MYAGTIVGFPSNQMSPILPCWTSLEQESIHYVSFNKVLRSLTGKKDLLEMLKDHLMYQYSLSENTQNQNFKTDWVREGD